MVDPNNGPDEAALAVAARHALHDEELVAAFATGSLDDASEVARAQQLVERCAACRELHRDVEAIGGALRGTAQFTTTAPRDFRLSVEDAVRLGGTVSPRGLVAGLRRALTSFARPLGASMTALGLVGLVLGSVTLGGPAGAPLSVDMATAWPTAVREVTSGAGQASSLPPGSTARVTAVDPGPTSFEDGGDGGAGGAPRDSDADAGSNPRAWLLGGSIGLLIGGVLLLALVFRRSRQHRARG